MKKLLLVVIFLIILFGSVFFYILNYKDFKFIGQKSITIQKSESEIRSGLISNITAFGPGGIGLKNSKILESDSQSATKREITTKYGTFTVNRKTIVAGKILVVEILSGEALQGLWQVTLQGSGDQTRLILGEDSNIFSNGMKLFFMREGRDRLISNFKFGILN